VLHDRTISGPVGPRWHWLRARLRPSSLRRPRWGPRRPKICGESCWKCLGGSWPDPCDLKPIIREKTQKDGYRLESVTYEVEPGEAVPAYVLIPDGINAGNPAPAVAVWHQHNGAYNLGKVEPAGLAGSPHAPHRRGSG